MRSCVYAIASDCRVTGSSVTPIARAVARSCAQLPPTRPVCASVERSRSKPRVVSATRHPSPTSPRRIASGTRTSLKNTSLNDAPPLIWRIGRTSIPGRSIGMMNAVRPLCFTASGSERAMSSPHSENKRAGAPDLLPVDDPLVAVTCRPAGQAAEVGSGAWLGEQLAAQLARAEEALDELPALDVVAERHDRRGDQPRRDAVRLMAGRTRVLALQLGERTGVLDGQPEPAELLRRRDGVVSTFRLQLRPALDPLEQRPLSLLGQGVEHGDVELALVPGELVGILVR